MEKGGAVPSTFTLRAGSGGGQKNAWWADAGAEGFKSSRRALTGLPRTCGLRSHRGLLDGDAPVLAAVKDRELPFLERVRAHPKCRSFFITPENRDRLFLEVLAQLRLQLHKD